MQNMEFFRATQSVVWRQHLARHNVWGNFRGAISRTNQPLEKINDRWIYCSRVYLLNESTSPDWLSCSVWVDILYRHSLKLFNLCSHLWSAQLLINDIIIKRLDALSHERLNVKYFKASTKYTLGMSHWYLYSIELCLTSVSMSMSPFRLKSLNRTEPGYEDQCTMQYGRSLATTPTKAQISWADDRSWNASLSRLNCSNRQKLLFVHRWA